MLVLLAFTGAALACGWVMHVLTILGIMPHVQGLMRLFTLGMAGGLVALHVFSAQIARRYGVKKPTGLLKAVTPSWMETTGGLMVLYGAGVLVYHLIGAARLASADAAKEQVLARVSDGWPGFLIAGYALLFGTVYGLRLLAESSKHAVPNEKNDRMAL